MKQSGTYCANRHCIKVADKSSRFCINHQDEQPELFGLARFFD